MVKLDFDKGDHTVIPAGAIVPLRMKTLPGNVPPDNVLTRSQKGDCSGLKVQCTVTDGEYAGRNFQVWYLIEGTTPGHAEARNNAMATFRAIIDAVFSLDACDKSPEAVSLRTGIDVADFFNGAVFLAEVGVEAGRPRPHGGGDYPARNVIVRILQPGDAEYQRLDQAAATAAEEEPSAT
jgi:hypothetical protein